MHYTCIFFYFFFYFLFYFFFFNIKNVKEGSKQNEIMCYSLKSVKNWWNSSSSKIILIIFFFQVRIFSEFFAKATTTPAQNCSKSSIFCNGLKFRLTSLLFNAVGPSPISQHGRPNMAAKRQKQRKKIYKKKKNSNSAVSEIVKNFIPGIQFLACRLARKNLSTLQVPQNAPNHPLLHQQIPKKF